MQIVVVLVHDEDLWNNVCLSPLCSECLNDFLHVGGGGLTNSIDMIVEPVKAQVAQLLIKIFLPQLTGE